MAAAATPPAAPRIGRGFWDRYGIALAVLVFVVAVLLVGAFWGRQIWAPLRWMIIAGLMSALLIVIGFKINRRADGILVDGRFKISLSRLQIILWTVVALSAFFTIALPRTMPGGMLELNKADAKTRQALQEFSPDKTACFTETATLPPECAPDALQIVFPGELIVALGISAASFAGSTLIKSVKRGQKVDISVLKEVQGAKLAVDQADAAVQAAEERADQAEQDLLTKGRRCGEIQKKLASAQDEEERSALQTDLNSAQKTRDEALIAFQEASAALDEARAAYDDAMREYELVKGAAEQETDGALHRNADPSQADWIDLFRGDEIGNYKLVDISKVQMFFFTIVLVVGYAAAVYMLLLDGTALQNPLGVSLPAFSESMNGLLAISHAGYLAVKTVDRTGAAQ